MNPRSRVPGPLDSLPRPLADRDRRGRGRRRLLALMTVAIIVGGVALGANAVARALPAAGEVAGVVATPTPSAPPDGAAPDPMATVAPGAFAPAIDDAPDVIPGASHGPAPATLTGYRWPVPHGRLTLPFGPTPWGSRIVHGKNFHDGIDLATFCGDRVVAAHDGVVLAAGRRYDKFIGWIGDLGPYVRRLDKKQLWQTLPIVLVIDDGNGYRSIYAHFSKVVVKKGETVKAGQLIGHEGATGKASGCHLHYGLFSPDESGRFGIDKDVAKRMKLPRWQIARIDPLLVLPARHKAAAPKPAASADSP